MAFLGTKQVARLLEVSINRLQRACWLGQIDPPPQKTPAGNFFWTIADIERASWVLNRRAFDPPEEMLAMINHGSRVA